MLLALCAWIVAQPAVAGVSDELDTAWSRITDMSAWSEPGDWHILASPYTMHWRPSPEHRHVVALGLERISPDRWLSGGSLFRNSFGQPSAYLYLGRRTQDLLGQPSLFAQWSAGLLYGYRGRYESKVPMNINGFAPGAVVSLGWQVDRAVTLTAHALGDAGVLFQVGWRWR